jgi:hypothetical protein
MKCEGQANPGKGNSRKKITTAEEAKAVLSSFGMSLQQLHDSGQRLGGYVIEVLQEVRELDCVQASEAAIIDKILAMHGKN